MHYILAVYESQLLSRLAFFSSKYIIPFLCKRFLYGYVSPIQMFLTHSLHPSTLHQRPARCSGGCRKRTSHSWRRIKMGGGKKEKDQRIKHSSIVTAQILPSSSNLKQQKTLCKKRRTQKLKNSCTAGNTPRHTSGTRSRLGTSARTLPSNLCISHCKQLRGAVPWVSWCLSLNATCSQLPVWHTLCLPWAIEPAATQRH